jgi:hypothetical protein
MKLDIPGKVGEAIVFSLSKKPMQTASELLKSVKEMGVTCSVQALYKALRSMRASNIIAKSKDNFFLDHSWTTHILEFADQIQKNQSSVFLLNQYPLSDGNHQIWHFKDLYRLNEFWSQVIHSLISVTKSSTILAWSPHPWYHLIETEHELEYVQSLKGKKIHVYMSVGGRTYLDKWATRYLDKETVTYSFSQSPFKKFKSTHIDVIGDYIIFIKLSDTTYRKIENLYAKVKSEHDPVLVNVVETFKGNTPARLWVVHDKEKADKLRRQFNNFFGLKEV